MVGSFLGLRGALLTLILGSVGGSVIGYTYIKVTKQDPDSYQLPFGTFLAAAGIASEGYLRIGETVTRTPFSAPAR